jgi:hypothetical protein
VFRSCSLCPYWVMLGVLTMICDVIYRRSLMLYKEEVWSPLGNILVITCCRNLCLNSFQNFFVTQVSPRAQVLIIQQWVVSLITHSALHQLLFLLISPNITYNKAAILPFESCGWCLEYQFFNSQNKPHTSCPQQPVTWSIPVYCSHCSREITGYLNGVTVILWPH